jgi:hypothetical protein
MSKLTEEQTLHERVRLLLSSKCHIEARFVIFEVAEWLAENHWTEASSELLQENFK